MPKAADRFLWAVEVLAVNPTDHLLEIGCGHGIAVSLIADQLTNGTITGIDRSQTMIDAASRKNHASVERGQASFQAATLDEAAFGEGQFDKIFAINVIQFWRAPAREYDLLKKWLKPDGALYIFYQAPDWDEAGQQDFADQLTAILGENGFTVRESLSKDMKPVPCIGVIAQVTSAL